MLMCPTCCCVAQILTPQSDIKLFHCKPEWVWREIEMATTNSNRQSLCK